MLGHHCSFCGLERDELSALVIQVAAKDNTEVRVIVESLDEVRKFTAILPAENSTARLGALRNSVRTGNEMDSGNQVNKEVAGQSLAIVCKAAPAEEAHGAKGPFRRAIEKGVPTDGWF